jgi:hypothetical protein
VISDAGEASTSSTDLLQQSRSLHLQQRLLALAGAVDGALLLFGIELVPQLVGVA